MAKTEKNKKEEEVTNSTESAFPAKVKAYHDPFKRTEITNTPGLTKREYFTAMALQGLLTAFAKHFEFNADKAVPIIENICSMAVIAADQTLATLDKNPKP